MSLVHEYQGIDPIDAILSPLFVASTLATTGLATVSVLGFGFGESIFTASGATVTLGWLLGAVALLGAYLTNQVNFAGFDEQELAIVGGMVVVHFATAFVPIVRDAVQDSQLIGIPIVMLMAAGYYLIAYY